MAIWSVSEFRRLSGPNAADAGTARRKKSKTVDAASSVRPRVVPQWAALEDTKAEFLLVALGFVIGRASLNGDLFPFAPAYVLAVSRAGADRRVALVTLATLAGMTTVLPFGGILPYALVLIAMALLGRRHGLKPERDALVAVSGMFASTAVLGIVGSLMNGGTHYLGTYALEGAILAAMTQVYTLSLRFWFRFHRSQPLAPEDGFAVSVLACSAVMGLSAVAIGPVTLGGVGSRLLIMVGAVVGGPAIGAALGAAMGLAVFISGRHLLGMYALGGLLGGAFRGRGRVGVSGGFLLATLIASMDMPTGGAVVSALAETAAAAAILAIVPKGWLMAGAKLVPGTSEHTDRETLRERRLRELVSKRLKDFSRIFNELSKTFAEGSPSEGQESRTFPVFLENVVRRSCLQCSGYQACWHDRLYKSYLMLLDLLALAEANGKVSLTDFPDGLHNKCIQPQALVSAINGAVEVVTAETLWEKRLRDSREIVSSQLKGVSRIMSGLANEMRMDLTYLEEQEACLRDELQKRRIQTDDVLVTDRGDGRLDVTVEMPVCKGECLCANSVAPAVGRALGRDLSVWNAKCAMGKTGAHCNFELVPRRQLDLVSEVIKVPKAGSVVSGDSYATLDLPGGKVALVLSDGMGAGPRAALESGATISMLRELVDAGFERDFAIRTINSVLMLRSPEETFSTIDMVIIDLHSGQTEFLKIGSAPSYIKRGSEVGTIKSSSVPVGILGSIEVKSYVTTLRHGDMLVMVTDGAVDAVRRSDKEEWIASALKRMDSTNPKEIASNIYNLVRRDGGKQAADDITILVTRVLNHTNNRLTPDESGIQTLNTGHYAS